jgi:hypothetical protein
MSVLSAQVISACARRRIVPEHLSSLRGNLGYPLRAKRPRVRVVYIDKDYLSGCVDARRRPAHVPSGVVGLASVV